MPHLQLRRQPVGGKTSAAPSSLQTNQALGERKDPRYIQKKADPSWIGLFIAMYSSVISLGDRFNLDRNGFLLIQNSHDFCDGIIYFNRIQNTVA